MKQLYLKHLLQIYVIRTSLQNSLLITILINYTLFKDHEIISGTIIAFNNTPTISDRKNFLFVIKIFRKIKIYVFLY